MESALTHADENNKDVCHGARYVNGVRVHDLAEEVAV